jgi:hypothetical protein
VVADRLVSPAEAALVLARARRFVESCVPEPPTLAGAWSPLPGPQRTALESPADELFYGGAAGGGKTDLLLGLALTQHRSAIIFRREYKQLRGVIERSREVIGRLGRFNGQENIWRFADDRIIELGAVEHEWDKAKYQGRPHALKAFDELPQFTESQYRFLIGWARTTVPGERVRVVAAGNPPTSAEGEWVIRYWGPWLDETHAHPADPGELRWYGVVDGHDVEVEDGRPFLSNGETIRPKSRTFLPARLSDNPYLEATGYAAILQGMPEPLRSQMLYGDFTIGLSADPYQLIERRHLTEARARPAAYDPAAGAVVAGLDVAGPGEDESVLVVRQGSAILAVTGFADADARGPVLAALRPWRHRGLVRVNVDSAGLGHYFARHLEDAGLRVRDVNVGEAPTSDAARERYANLKAELYWSLRERFADGDVAGLTDQATLAQLAGLRYQHDARGRVKIESKDDAQKRGVKSPDRAEALMLAFAPDDPRALRAGLYGLTTGSAR